MAQRRETAVEAAWRLIDNGQVTPGAKHGLLAWAAIQDAEVGRTGPIRAAGRGTSPSPSPAAASGDLGDDEADRLFAPKTLAASAARYAEADRRRAAVAAMSDDELFRSMGFQAAAGDYTHPPTEGTHSHPHASYDGSGGVHSHEHSHDGDASHGSDGHVQQPSHTQAPELGDGEPG